jgi:hypothetical protein
MIDVDLCYAQILMAQVKLIGQFWPSKAGGFLSSFFFFFLGYILLLGFGLCFKPCCPDPVLLVELL